MTKQPIALKLAQYWTVKNDQGEYLYSSLRFREETAAKLRQLHALNQELLKTLKLALYAHGVLLLNDPPQDAWKAYGIEQKARAIIAKAEDEQ